MTDLHKMVNGLRQNGRDSIIHALDHFSAREVEPKTQSHHDKWALVSVHHAAECILNARLLEIDPTDSIFASKGGGIRFPSLRATLDCFKKPQIETDLSPAERHLLNLMGDLPAIRDKFMHQPIPEKVDVSIAAMCLIGLLKFIEERTGETASDFVWQSPPIETAVVAAMRHSSLDAYKGFMELYLKERHPTGALSACPACGVDAVISHQCQVCFEELSYVFCPEFHEPVHYLSWQRQLGDLNLECSHCGGVHTVD